MASVDASLAPGTAVGAGCTATITFFDGDSEWANTLSLPIDNESTMIELRRFVAKHGQLDRAAADAIEFCELTATGEDRPLPDSANAAECMRKNSRIVMVSAEHQFVVVFLPDGKEFVLVKCAGWDATVRQICKHPALTTSLAEIERGALYLATPTLTATATAPAGPEDELETAMHYDLLDPDEQPLKQLYSQSPKGGARIRRPDRKGVRLVFRPSGDHANAERLAVPASVGWFDCADTPVEPRMEGELWKRSDDALRKWRKRWFELDPDQGLAYWDTKADFDMDTPPAMRIELTALLSVDVAAAKKGNPNASSFKKKPEAAQSRMSMMLVSSTTNLRQGITGFMKTGKTGGVAGKGDKDHSIVVRTSVAGRAEINIASDSHAVCLRWAAALRAAIVPVTYDGWLQKKGERANSGWRYRWFELRGQKLLYFEAEGRAQKGCIDLDGSVQFTRNTGERCLFNIVVLTPAKTPKGLGKRRGVGFSFKSKSSRNVAKSVYQIKAGDAAEMDQWMTQLSRARDSASHRAIAEDEDVSGGSSKPHKRAVYANWLPASAVDAFDDGEARSSIHRNIFVDRSTGTPQVQVVDCQTKVATVLPEECAHYILVDPDDSDDEAATYDSSVNESSAVGGGGGGSGGDACVENTFISSGLSEQTLHQLLDFLQHREQCELDEISKAYADRARRIQDSILNKVMGTPGQRALYDRFYHGPIARGAAEAMLLRAGGSPGTYLLRLKELYKKYVISLCVQDGTFMHFLVEARDGASNFTFMGEPLPCPSVYSILEEMQKPPATRLTGLRRSGPQFLHGVEVEVEAARPSGDRLGTTRPSLYMEMQRRVDYGVDQTI